MFKCLLVVMSLVSSVAFASGELVAGGYYLDDVNQSVSPKLGIKASSGLLPDKWSDSLYAGGGYFSSLEGSSASPWYGELKADVYYAGLSDGLKVGVGGGLILSKPSYSSLDDYLHVSVSYKLW